MVSRWVVLVAAAAMVGCGSGGGGSSGGGSTVTPPPVTLLSISVTPSSATLRVEDTVALTVTGSYSDGSIAPVSASWTSSNALVATVAPAFGAAAMATALDDGTASIQASFQGKTSICSLTATSIPDDPGPVYGIDEMPGNVWAYPADGGDPSLLASIGVSLSGFCMNRTNDALYAILDVQGVGGGDAGIVRISPNDGSVTLVADLPDVRFISCDADALGRIYAYCATAGSLYRCDPATGLFAPVGTVPGWQDSTVIGGDDAPYYGALFGRDWITRHNLSTDAATTWGTAPAEAGSNSYGFVTGAGLAINAKGEAFIADPAMSYVWKYVDLNGDGDASDAGEASLFADLPDDGSSGEFIFGLSEAPGNTVLVQATWSWGPGGIWWLVDRNRDGDALDEGEATIHNSTVFLNGTDGGCIAARRR